MKEETAMVQTFVNEQFGEVRTVIINGEPYFVGKDVATALGYANPRDALAKHVESEDKMNINLNTVANRDGIHGNPNVTVINESGLYSLILTSTLPTAKEFKHWVTSEVLPSIRKTGEYKINGAETSGGDKLFNKLIELAKVADDKGQKFLIVNKAMELLGVETVPPSFFMDDNPSPPSSQCKYKLSREQISVINRLYNRGGTTIRELAEIYGVSRETIRIAIKRK